MARYKLCRYVLAQPGEIEISESEYRGLAQAVQTLVELSDAEQKYNVFIDNYFELERGLLEGSLRAMIYRNLASEMQDAKADSSRRIMNLLTSVKLYLDSYPQHADWLVAGEELTNLKAAPSRAYDRSLAYRILEALRNYAQHEAFPIQVWQVQHSRDDSTTPARWKVGVNPKLDVGSLSRSRQFKRSVLAEIEKTGAVHLKPLIREYIEQLSMVHEEFRAATEASADAAEKALKAALDRFIAEHPGDARTVVALSVGDDGTTTAEDPLYISAPVLETIRHLRARIDPLKNYARRWVDY